MFNLKPGFVLLGAATMFGAALAFSMLTGGGDTRSPPQADLAATPTTAPGAPAELPRGSDASQPQAIVSIAIPAIEVDAPIVTLGVDDAGVMESPSNPIDVAWYGFSGLPNEGTNVVLAAHVDYVNYGTAVFSRLPDLQPGDEVQLRLEDGTVARYAVSSSETYPLKSAPVQAIVGATASEVVTLITCGGSFDPNSEAYNKRVVVRADRISDSMAANPQQRSTNDESEGLGIS